MGRNKKIAYRNNNSDNPFEGLSSKPPGEYTVVYKKTTYVVSVHENAQTVNVNCGGTWGQNDANPDISDPDYNTIDIAIGNNSQTFRTASVGSANEAINLIRQEFNTETNPTYIGYSLNGVDAVRMAGKYAMDNPDYRGGIAVSIEASTNDPASDMGVSPEVRDALINSDTLVINAFNHDRIKVPARSLSAYPEYYTDQENNRMVHFLDINVTFIEERGRIVYGGKAKKGGTTGGHHILYEWLNQSGISNLGTGRFSFNDLLTEFTIIDNYGDHVRGPHTYKLDTEKIVFTERFIDENGEYVEREFHWNEEDLRFLNEILFKQNWKTKFGDRVKLPFDNASDEDMDFYGLVLRNDDEYIANWLSSMYSDVNKIINNMSNAGVQASSSSNLIAQELTMTSRLSSMSHSLADKYKSELKAIAAVSVKNQELDRSIKNDTAVLEEAI